MSYIVFARKYRPKVFDEVVGQDPITTTLKNAVSQGRVAHAYIFAGPRGVGKTTTARILAKALNCEKGPSPSPCNSCVSCKEITQGSSLDILEIDGASNRGIDEIRNLRETIKFAPSKGRFRVYIIDEVHMLTAEAFNAILKTLEEPPPHAKFIFATTQPHKIPPTILSRCQRFDFRRISTKDIFDNLKDIVKREDLNVMDEALILIARYSDGSMRDGQVILDQVVSFTQGKADVADIVKILGIVDKEILFGLADSIYEKDTVKALKMIDNLINEGKDVLQVISGLIEHFRNISIIKVSVDLDSLIDESTDNIKRYEAQANGFSIEEILYIIATLSNAIDFMRKSSLARVPLETAMVKLTRMGPVASLTEIVERISGLEESLRKGAPPEPHKGAAGEERIENRAQAASKPEEPDALKWANAANIDEISSLWNRVINYIKPKKMSIASYLEEGYPASLEGRVLTIGFPKTHQFHKEVLESADNKQLIEEAVNATLKTDLQVIFILVEPVAAKNRPVKEYSGNVPEGAEYAVPDEEPAKKDVEPIVKSALDIFNGSILKERKEAK